MSTNIENPYREGSTYHKLFSILQRSPATRQKLVDFARKNIRLRRTAAEAAVGVVLSPREKSKRGDCRGNLSAAGHVYFVAKKETQKGSLYEAKPRKKAMKPRRQTAAA
jgi:hypothetical protein